MARANLVIHGAKMDLAFALELTLDLAVKGPLAGLNGQEEASPSALSC
jgi:hypothetical protein